MAAFSLDNADEALRAAAFLLAKAFSSDVAAASSDCCAAVALDAALLALCDAAFLLDRASAALSAEAKAEVEALFSLSAAAEALPAACSEYHLLLLWYVSSVLVTSTLFFVPLAQDSAFRVSFSASVLLRFAACSLA